MANNGQSRVFIWGSAQTDVNKLLSLLTLWLDGHRASFGEIGNKIKVDPPTLVEAYCDLHYFLSVCGESANGCKRAAAVIAALCMHCPIVPIEGC